MLGGGPNIHGIQFSEDPTLRGGPAAWRRTQLKEGALAFEGPNSQKIQLGGGCGSWRRIQHSEKNLVLRGSSSRRIQFLKDPALEGGSGAQRIQLLEDTIL